MKNEVMLEELAKIYYEDGFTELILFCEQEGLFDKEKVRYIFDNYRHNPYGDEENYWEWDLEIVLSTLDEIGLTEKVYTEYFKKFEAE